MLKLLTLLAAATLAFSSAAIAADPVDYTDNGVSDGRVHESHESEATGESCCHNRRTERVACTSPACHQRVQEAANGNLGGPGTPSPRRGSGTTGGI